MFNISESLKELMRNTMSKVELAPQTYGDINYFCIIDGCQANCAPGCDAGCNGACSHNCIESCEGTCNIYSKN